MLLRIGLMAGIRRMEARLDRLGGLGGGEGWRS